MKTHRYRKVRGSKRELSVGVRADDTPTCSRHCYSAEFVRIHFFGAMDFFSLFQYPELSRLFPASFENTASLSHPPSTRHSGGDGGGVHVRPVARQHHERRAWIVGRWTSRFRHGVSSDWITRPVRVGVRIATGNVDGHAAGVRTVQRGSGIDRSPRGRRELDLTERADPCFEFGALWILRLGQHGLRPTVADDAQATVLQTPYVPGFSGTNSRRPLHHQVSRSRLHFLRGKKPRWKP